MKRFLTLAVLFLLLIGTMPVAHAQEIIPEVSTLSELQDAIAQAEEGDTIKITQTITINFPVTLGIDGKPVTLCGADGLETLLRFEGDWGYASYCWLYDLTIDGTGSFDGSKVVVSALAGAGVFCGQSDSSFKADNIMTYGQLLTVLTRFVEPKEGYIGSFNVLDHWAAPAALTAASYGWIEDVPIDLNAPATYGAL